ncbi:MAG: DNA-directed RNA polymerase subunit alpha [bacterium]|nr:DNA-directed RNA polymerase subunit alpha [bacterium]
MRIRWRGLELPSKVERDERASTDTYGRFIIEPFERGFGTTVGNSLRRILLSSLEGAAVTAIKIAEAPHEFATIPGVLEDVTDIILNIKNIVVRSESDEPKTMRVHRAEPGEIRAGDIEADAALEITNPDLVLCTLTAETSVTMEMTVGKGRGYCTAEENRGAEQELGIIPVDSIFSPVLRVRYRTEDTRVGQRTNYDRLILEIWTRGTYLPEDTLVEAAKILRKHLNPFVMYHSLGEEMVETAAAPTEGPAPAIDAEVQRKWDLPIATLNLSVRATNCLESGRVTTLGALASMTEADLLRVRSFGKTSLREVRRKLAEHGLGLGMSLEQQSGNPSPPGEGEADQPASAPAAPPDNLSVPVEQN